jgi:hypothetical protein
MMPVLELLTLVDCGCKVSVYGDGSGVEVEYCALHQAAPAMLAALKVALVHNRLRNDDDAEWYEVVLAAIAEADPDSVVWDDGEPVGIKTEAIS